MKFVKILLLILAGILGANSIYAAEAQGQLLDRVVAVVNDEAITQSELDGYLQPLYNQLKTEYQGSQLADQINEARKKLINQLIEDKLVYQKAKDMKLEAGEGDLRAEMENLKKKFGSDKTFEETMSKEGYSLSALKDRINRQLMVRRLHDMEVRSKVIVSPIEIENYYKEHISEFVSKPSIKVRSMTLKKSEQAREKGLTDEAAMKKMEDFRKRVLASEDFAQLAMANSEDYQAAQGGLSDWTEPGALIPVINDVIFDLKVGEVSKIIETPMGYHFFRVEEKREGKESKFEQVRDEIFDKIYREKAKKRFEDWMNELKRQAFISLR